MFDFSITAKNGRARMGMNPCSIIAKPTAVGSRD
jgi:hypothetical protein